MLIPRLVLINPSNQYKGLGNVRSTAWPPLNLPYIAALTPSHYKIEVIDENIRPFAYREADIVGITAYTSTAPRAYEIAKIYRDKNIPVVMGGIHASMLPDEAADYCDVVVTGEAEGVWSKLLDDFEAGTLRKRYDGGLADLSDLPLPRRDVLLNEYYTWGSLQTSRGCPLNCSFCSVTAFNGMHFRRRPLEHVIEDVKQIPQKFVLLADDNLIGHTEEDKAWAREFFIQLRKEGIKKHFFAQGSIKFGEDRELIRLASAGGLRIIFIGIESINPESLRGHNKGLNLKQLLNDQYKEHIENIRKGGIAVLGAFILGSDEDTPATFAATLDFIRSSHIDVVQITKPTPLPGTKFWEQLCHEGRILDQDYPKDWSQYRLSKMVFEPKRMTREDVYKGFTYIRRKYYQWPETARRTLSTLLTTKSLISTVLSYKFDQSYRRAFFSSEHFRTYKASAFEQLLKYD